MIEKTITAVKNVEGEVRVPGDKSISHRALLVSAIAEGVSEITGLSSANDVNNTKSCLKKLGVKMEKKGGKILVHGNGLYGFTAPGKVLNVGNSGTTIRLLSGILAAQSFECKIDGDGSIRKRPMRRVIEPLEKMGARIQSESYKAPLKIMGGPLRAISHASSISSAQVKSCVLLAGLFAKGITRVTEPALSRDHTERILSEYGVSCQSSQSGAGVIGPAKLHPCQLDVPGDISAAAFFLVAACLLKESKITLPNIGINTTRTGILDVLSSMGASISKSDLVEQNNEPRATIMAKSSELKATSLGGSIIPRIIDEIPIIAVAATQAEGTTIIRDATELRVKETDRIMAVSENLRRMGANVRETKDGMMISGPTELQGAHIDSYGDHRIAMSFAIAGLMAKGETVIENVDCVDTSFPGFFSLLESVCHD